MDTNNKYCTVVEEMMVTSPPRNEPAGRPAHPWQGRKADRPRSKRASCRCSVNKGTPVLNRIWNAGSHFDSSRKFEYFLLNFICVGNLFKDLNFSMQRFVFSIFHCHNIYYSLPVLQWLYSTTRYFCLEIFSGRWLMEGIYKNKIKLVFSPTFFCTWSHIFVWLLFF